ncbi:MAG TPA: M48 family metallopeptidase [Thermoanaerobaculia bacterium]|nr:M48 family metallopeptidase [Thermoanaerobaculia bacterium]
MRVLCLLVILVVSGEQRGAGESAGSLAPRAPGLTPRLEVRVTGEMRRHSRIRDALYFGGTAYTAAVLLFLLAGGWSRRLRDWARRMAQKPFLTAMLYVVLFSFAAAVLFFPLTLYGEFVVPHQFGLTGQTFSAWLWDAVKALLLDTAIGAPVGALALLAVRRVRRWWLALWLGSIPLMVVLVVIAPVAFDPVFNDFRPLRDRALEARLLAMAEKAGIERSRVWEVDRSRQTTTMNAYVTGLGPTKRIVLWDTLLAKLSDDEIVAVMGHEMGHYVLHHVWKGLAFGVLVSLAVCLTGQRVYEWGVRRWGGAWGVEGAGDPASLPWLLLVGTLLAFLLAPVTNGFSRRIEHEADRYGIELTGLNRAAASAFVKFAEDSKVNPDPHPFIAFWRYSHPPLKERIEFALAFPAAKERSGHGAE